MINTSAQFKEAIRSSSRELSIKATLSSAAGTIELTPEDIEGGSLSIRSSIISGEFGLGSVDASDLTITLDNRTGRWDEFKFNGAMIEPYCGVKVADGNFEYVHMGKFIIDRPGRPYSIIQLQASDRMILLDVPLKQAAISFPANHRQILDAISHRCGVPLHSSISGIANIGHVVEVEPDGDMTCRDAVSEIAGMAGGYATITRDGYLAIKRIAHPPVAGKRKTWQDAENSGITYGEHEAAGMTWQRLGNAAGVTWIGEELQGTTWRCLSTDGTTWDRLQDPDFHETDPSAIRQMDVGSRFNLTQLTELLEISGVAYRDKIVGSDEYAVVLGDMAFLPEDDPEIDNVLANIWGTLQGFRYTAYTADYPGDPSVEPGDMVYHRGRKGKPFYSFVGSHTYKHGGHCTMAAEGKSKAERRHKGGNARRLSQIAAKAEHLEKLLTSYQLESAQLAEMMGLMLGVYPTTKELEDGSKIYYFHDAPELEDSMEIWMFNGKAFTWSIDGGATWHGGITVDSKLIIRQVIAEGVNAQYVHLEDGTLDEEIGKVHRRFTDIESGHIILGDKLIKDYIDDGDSDAEALVTELRTDIEAGRIAITQKELDEIAQFEVTASALQFLNAVKYFKIDNADGKNFIEAGADPEHLVTYLSEGGDFYTQSGEIGGWRISEQMLTTGKKVVDGKEHEVNRVGIHSAEDNDALAFWAGWDGDARHPAPFYVTHGGDFYAQNAYIEGEIYSQRGVIGGLLIEDWRLVGGHSGSEVSIGAAVIPRDPSSPTGEAIDPGECLPGHASPVDLTLPDIEGEIDENKFIVQPFITAGGLGDDAPYRVLYNGDVHMGKAYVTDRLEIISSRYADDVQIGNGRFVLKKGDTRRFTITSNAKDSDYVYLAYGPDAAGLVITDMTYQDDVNKLGEKMVVISDDGFQFNRDVEFTGPVEFGGKYMVGNECIFNRPVLCNRNLVQEGSGGTYFHGNKVEIETEHGFSVKSYSYFERTATFQNGVLSRNTAEFFSGNDGSAAIACNGYALFNGKVRFLNKIEAQVGDNPDDLADVIATIDVLCQKVGVSWVPMLKI